MRTKILPLAAVSALCVAAAACSDDDSTEVTSVPLVDTDVSETTDPPDAAEPDPTEPAMTDPETTDPTMSEPDTTEADTTESDATESDSSAVVTGFAGSWLPEDVAELQRSEANTIPVIDPSLADERVAEDHWVWDWWPVRDRDGNVAEIDGVHIAIALSAPADVLPGKRHDIATHRYLVSDDGGLSWTDGGELFPEGSEELLGTRQWAGSAMFDADSSTLYAFYTAAGEADDAASTVAPTTDAPSGTDGPSDDQVAPSGGSVGDDISYRQRLAVATAELSVVDGEVRFDDWTDHEVLLTGAETGLYSSTQATEGGAGQIDAFRDPWYHLDEETGEEYVLFTATMPQAECEGDGVVGIARSTSDDLREWEVLPPMFDGHCVNNELERPHIVIEDDLTYLLFTTHSHTFRDDTSGPEGLYGFVADDFLGTYEPLNGTGLVLANPQEAPYQAYSWMTLPNGIATSFFQFFDVGTDVEISYIGEQSPEFQREHFGGTFAPSLLIEFEDDTTQIVDVLEPGQLVL